MHVYPPFVPFIRALACSLNSDLFSIHFFFAGMFVEMFGPFSSCHEQTLCWLFHSMSPFLAIALSQCTFVCVRSFCVFVCTHRSTECIKEYFPPIEHSAFSIEPQSIAMSMYGFYHHVSFSTLTVCLRSYHTHKQTHPHTCQCICMVAMKTNDEPMYSTDGAKDSQKLSSFHFILSIFLRG